MVRMSALLKRLLSACSTMMLVVCEPKELGADFTRSQLLDLASAAESLDCEPLSNFVAIRVRTLCMLDVPHVV